MDARGEVGGLDLAGAVGRDGTRQVVEQDRLEPERGRVLRAPEHADVAREPREVDAADAELAKVAGEPRGGPRSVRPVVLAEGRLEHHERALLIVQLLFVGLRDRLQDRDALRAVRRELDAREQELVVAVWDPTERGPQPRGKQASRPGGIWYTPTTGIWQTVWLEPVNAECHVRRLWTETGPAGGKVTVRADIAGFGHESQLELWAVASLDGAAFDQAYATNEVAFHRTVNGALKDTLIPSADNAELKGLLETGLTLFGEHQAHAEHLAAALK